MREIKELSDEMKEELEGAKCYAKLYVNYKSSNPSLAKKYYEMANDELKHANYLHEMAVEKINKVKEENLSFPEYMEMIWKDKHDAYIDEMANIKVILAM